MKQLPVETVWVGKRGGEVEEEEEEEVKKKGRGEGKRRGEEERSDKKAGG